MKLVFLGTGTSQGIPVVGCTCEVCRSGDTRDQRLRSAVMFIKDDFHLLIDVTPDLRQQLLANQLDNIDAICITHEHNDHVSGLDDVRPVNFKWNKSLPIYTLPRVMKELRRRFYYAFEERYAARPRLHLHPIEAGDRLTIGPFDVQAIAVSHGYMDILGFIVNNVAYMTDIKSLSAETILKVSGCDQVVLSALHKRTHNSHQTLDEALHLVNTLGVTRAYITHIAHQMGFHAIESMSLPEHVQFAYDGLVVDCENTAVPIEK